MLTPFVFSTFTVLIKERLPIRHIANSLSRSTDNLLSTTTCYRYFIKFGHSSAREEGTLCRILDIGREYHILAIRSKCRRKFRYRISGQLLCTSTFCRYHINIKITITIASKSDLLAIRTPNRITLKRRLSSQLLSGSSLCINSINIALITESDSRSVWRNLHITQPKRCNCLASKSRYTKGHTG